ncbi:MAG TPA: class I SAM-dependent methyltransferase [Cyclobacteriaceae bacterium]|nr:class I SAM-dependent methyltransferase [Cyclobacteriaceae bacterium]
MKVTEGIRLIESGFHEKIDNSTWADLGCGNGLFTKALASFLGDGSKIYAVDKVEQSLELSFNNVAIEFTKADFVNDSFQFTNLNGVLMANSLHYIKDKSSFLENLKKSLKQNGQIIIVEYEIEKANVWVPYPIHFNELESLLSIKGFGPLMKLGERESIFGAEKMYACSAKLLKLDLGREIITS